jgi:hypothetical protein
MTYIAYLCYPRPAFGDVMEDIEPEIKFEKPAEREYEKILAIQFSVLHTWLDKDRMLYK